MLRQIVNGARHLPGYNYLRTHPALGRAALYCIPDIVHQIQIDPIGPFAIRLRRHRSFWLRNPFDLETFMLGALARLIRPGNVVYDIGANVGLYARFIAQHGAGRVVAFEPMTENLDLLRRNVALSERAAHIEVIAAALGDRDGVEELQLDTIMSATAVLSSVSSGRASAGHEQYGLPARTEQVRVARLDTLVGEGLTPPDVMKIDVEGAEELVLRGGSTTLRSRPRLVIELHGVDVGRRVVHLLRETGYFVAGVVRSVGDYEGTYREVTEADADRLVDFYDLQHVVASPDKADVESDIRLPR